MITSDAAIIEKADALLRAGKNDEAIDVLRSPGAPRDPRLCALLASRKRTQHPTST